MKSRILLYVMLVLGATSCVTSSKVNYMQEPDKTIPAYTDTLTYQEYVLQEGDRLFIQVYSIDEKVATLFNSGVNNIRTIARQGSSSNSDLYTYLIDEKGNITFPTIGEVYVKGLTTRQVKHRIEEGLAGVIVQHGTMPNISVEVQIVQRYFSVIGEGVGGRFNIEKEKITIFEALAMAGNIGEFGDRSQVHIIRESADSTVVRTFDVRSADIINSEYYYIEPNDVIYIQQMKGKSFGLTSAGATLSVVASTLSFGVFIYTLVDRFIVQPVQNSQNE